MIAGRQAGNPGTREIMQPRRHKDMKKFECFLIVPTFRRLDQAFLPVCKSFVKPSEGF
jgi:hypothetical protein